MSREINSFQLAKRAMKRIRQGYSGNRMRVFTGYTLLEEPDKLGAYDGWRDNTVAQRQHKAFVPLLQAARLGKPRLDFVVAAKAIKATALADPFVIEVGCGSGYYSEVLPLLLKYSVDYAGIDYASSMTMLARRIYPNTRFLTGDACDLPLEAGSCDILLSGTSLMHIAEYQKAIAESVRVSREWCIFHTVPVMEKRSTTFLSKQAYGESVIEVIFNKLEFESMLVAQGLRIQEIFRSIPYDVKAAVGEHTWTLTYLCQKNL